MRECSYIGVIKRKYYEIQSGDCVDRKVYIVKAKNLVEAGEKLMADKMRCGDQIIHLSKCDSLDLGLEL